MIKTFLREVTPAPIRRILRESIVELPIRLRDLGPDIADAWGFRSPTPPLPPSSLRRAIARNSSRKEFLQIGATIAADVLEVLERTGSADEQHQRWLDFGCGAGRVGRFLIQSSGLGSYCGVDVDDKAVAWAADHLRGGRFIAISRTPPLPFPERNFDVVLAISVFSHFSEGMQDQWLSELHRVLRPGGLLIASTHNPDLVYARPDLSAAQRSQLKQRGFLFAPGSGSFSEDSAFHAEEYMLDAWSPNFERRSFTAHGLAGYQDLSVWRNRG